MSASYLIRPFTVFCVFILSSFSDGQLFHASPNSLALPNSENEFKIELIDVKCDKDHDGMHITINFSQPFGGVIYSQGYFDDSKCKYVTIGENKMSYEFMVPLKGCGSKRSCAICDSIDNILIIQQDEEVQGEFDMARKVSCSRTGIDEEKKVFFKPFVVDMLDVINVPTANGGVDCWMNIQRGTYPKLSAIGDVIKIGEQLTILVYLRDNKMEYDLSVRNCWAYDNQDFDDKKTGKVQLSDASGCSMKRKLFGIWQKTSETGSSSGATLLLHNTLRAFKFPNEAQVYLKCDIEICRGTCAEAICDDNFNGMKDADCKLYPSQSKCLGMNLIERFTTPLPSERFTTFTTKAYDEITTHRFDSRFPFDITTTDKDIPEIESTTIQTTEPNFFYNPTRRPGFSCYDGSTDPKCVQQKLVDLPTTLRNNLPTTPRMDFTYSNLIKTTTMEPKVTTYPDLVKTTRKPEAFTYRNLIKPSTIKPRDQFKMSTKWPSFCKLYPNSKRCITKSSSKPQTTTIADESLVEILTFKPPKPQIEPDCSRNPNDIRCRQLIIPLKCEPGSPFDPRCSNPKSTGAPTYLPPTTTLPTQSTGKFLICVPGANGKCEGETERATTESEITTKIIPTQFVTRPKPICSFGSTDPECKKVTTSISTPKPKPSTTQMPTTRQSYVTTSSKIPIVTTTNRPKISTFATKTTQPQAKCYPGSLDPRCATDILDVLDCDKNPSDIRCNQVMVPLRCGPGIPYDVRCENAAATKVPATFFPFTSTTTTLPTRLTTRRVERPLCTFGSTNPECKKVKSNILNLKPEPITTAIPIITEQPITESSTFESSTIPLELTTTPRLIPTTKQPIIITTKTYPSKAPICYPGALDPRCLSFSTTKKIVSPSSIPLVTTAVPNLIISTTDAEPKCFPGSSDVRCKKLVTTQVPSTYSTYTYSTTERRKTTSKISIKPEATTPRIDSKAPMMCYPGTLDPRCRSTITTEKITTSSETPISTTSITKILKGRCYPGSLDPLCKQGEVQLKCGFGYPYDARCPNPTPTATPPTYLPPKSSGFTTSQTTENVNYETTTYPSSISSTQKSISTTIPTKFTERPYTTEKLITSTLTTTTKKVSRVSSPRPFTTRPTIQSSPSSTENILCYPGSPISGCKPSKITTPSYCFPGSNDKRCPQLPDTFSTRKPATYLPPFLDFKLNRVKRNSLSVEKSEYETVKFQMSFKSLNFA